MADESGWKALCAKCDQIYKRYGEGREIPSDPGNGPLVEFDGVRVKDHVFRFVIYILWFKKQPDSLQKYRTVRAERYDLFKESIYQLWTL